MFQPRPKALVNDNRVNEADFSYLTLSDGILRFHVKIQLKDKWQ